MSYFSILEVIYLIYMFHFFETNIDFNITSSPEGWWFKHLIGNEYGLRVCPFGRIAIFIPIALILLRHIIHIPKIYIQYIISIALAMSLSNLNAFVYLLPIFFIEIFY